MGRDDTPRKSRSRSAASRSRERASRSRRERSRSTPRRDSRRRSRSASRGRRERSSRRRDRSRDRRGSGRKRSRRDRSRSADGRRHHHHDDESRKRRQRRRRDSDAGDSAKTLETKPQEAGLAAEHQPVTIEKAGAVTDEAVKANEEPKVVGKDETPTSQDSVATSTATATTSSQSDVEVTATTESSQALEQARPTEETESKAGGAAKPAVDVKSIKMDIMKALADARSTIAGIKGASAPIATAGAAPAPLQQAPQPETESQPPTTASTEVASPKIETSQPSGDHAVSSSSSSNSPADEPVPPAPPSVVTADGAKKEVAAADVDEFDMFSAADLHGAGLPLSPLAGPTAVVVNSAVQSNYDDADGYYKPSIGEILNSKYRVMGTVGKGVFSIVLRCQRIASISESEPDMVAIKLIRNNEVMRDASQTEIKILTEISERDPRDKKHCVRLLDRFEHRNHVALVFESMQMNVREAMKKFGGKGGISIQAVRVFCRHMLIALSHLEACGVVHADIKPDNVLLDEKQTMIKLCDFGSAFESNEGKHDPTPYLVSRFYRAPEIVLGLPYDKAVDMWSVGCCLYEMFTGKVMFPGATNNEMLKLFMELKGKVPNKIIKKHRQAYIEQLEMEPHFTEDNKFCSHELDRVTGKPVLRLMDAIKTRFDLGSALLGAKSSTDDRKQVLELRNLLERMFTLDPAKRITPKEALAHPFAKTEGKQAAS